MKEDNEVRKMVDAIGIVGKCTISPKAVIYDMYNSTPELTYLSKQMTKK